MKAKVNYVIATWSGKRRQIDIQYLRRHLIKLLSLEHNLEQITIVKPITSDFNSQYYDIENIINKFKCKVEILEKYSNDGQSYGQWFHTYEKYKNEFDYYIFIEDDYLPDCDNFDDKLVDEYVSQKVNGYLCSFTADLSKYPKGGCSISNGIISTSFLEKIYKQYKNPIKVINDKSGDKCHMNFVNLLWSCNFEFKDFAKKYRVPYNGTGIIEYGRKDISECIFTPTQLFNIQFTFNRMSIDDLPLFLKIRNMSNKFLHNNSTFTIEEATKWFNKYNPEFIMINMNNISIGYFRISNRDDSDKSMYIGADIHPDYRNLGLGYMAYKQYIKYIFGNTNILKLKLEVLSTNPRAIHLYEKLGFIKTNIEYDKFIRDGIVVNNIIMELNK